MLEKYKNKKLFNEALKCLRKNDIIVYPTDTCYGVIAKFSSKNQKRINDIKKRTEHFIIPVLYTEVKVLTFLSPQEIKKLEDHNAEHTSYVVRKNFNPFRKIYDDSFNLRKLINKSGPLLASSFNHHGSKVIDNKKDANRLSAEMNIPLFFFKKYKNRQPSKIIDITLDKKNKVIRI